MLYVSFHYSARKLSCDILLSQFVNAPTSTHYVALRIHCYLHETMTQSLLFPSSSSLTLRAYSDVGWVDDLDTCRLILVIPPLISSFFLDLPLSLGVATVKILLLGLVLMQNIERWLTLQ